MKLINLYSITVILLLASMNANAEWSYTYNSLLKRYIVSDGSQSINYKKKKSAEEAVEVLNTVDVSKKEEGKVYDDGSGLCDRPGVVC